MSYEKVKEIFRSWDSYLTRAQDVIDDYRVTQENDGSNLTGAPVSKDILLDQLGGSDVDGYHGVANFVDAWAEAERQKFAILRENELRILPVYTLDEHGEQLISWYETLDSRANELANHLEDTFNLTPGIEYVKDRKNRFERPPYDKYPEDSKMRKEQEALDGEPDEDIYRQHQSETVTDPFDGFSYDHHLPEFSDEHEG